MKRRSATVSCWMTTLVACLLLLNAPVSAAVVEDVFQLPIEVKDIYGRSHQHNFTVTVFRDDSRPKSPFMVISHGRSSSAIASRARTRYEPNSHYFVGKGFAVFVPTRVGYGVTGGPDVEDGGDCARRQFEPIFEAGATQVAAVVAYAKAQPYIDPARGVLVGQSFGGAITVLMSSKNIPGVAVAINFAGGSGGDPDTHPENPCSEPALRQLYAQIGRKATVPMLWLYSENDRFWGKDKPRAWFEAFRANGAAAEFVQLPAHGRNGHGSFTDNPGAWKPAVQAFLARAGFAQ